MQLLEHFNELSLHSKNAKKLKELIVRLALRGDLTEYWRNENPNIISASELIKLIKKDREELLKERKVKLKKISEIPATIKMMYKLPISWQWQNLPEVVFFQEGPGIRTWQFRDQGIKLLNVQNIVGDSLVLDNTNKYIEKEEFEQMYSHFQVEEGDLLFASSGGSWGKSAWFKDDGYPVMLNTSMIRLRFFSSNWYPDYLKSFISSEFFKDQMREQLVGIQPNFGSTHLSRVYIPIPPLEEQKAIVEVVNQLFAEVDQLETLTKERIHLKEDFVTSALRQLSIGDTSTEWAFLKEHFSTFFTEKANIKKLRESVLQLGVQGKLTSDWRKQRSLSGVEVEHASVLLKRIQKEKEQLIKEKKIKKEKPLPKISDEEIPYELPEGWVWEYLGNSMLKITDGTHHSPTNVEHGNYKYVTAKNIKNDGIKLSNITYVTDDVHREIYSRCNPELGDLLYIKDGATTGICCINNLEEEFSMLSSVALIKQPKDVVGDYLLSIFRSPYYYELMRSGMTGVAITRVTLTKLKNSLIPLPPIEEQKAIVQKVNSLMALCNELEAAIETSKTTQELWMESSLREVFEGGINVVEV